VSTSHAPQQLAPRARTRRVAIASTLLALVASVFVGCGETTGPDVTTGDVRLVSEQAGYRAGDVARLAVINASDRPVTGGLCPLSLQRLRQGRWLPVLPDTLGLVSACDAVRVLVQPGDTLALSMQLDTRLPSGTYRIEHRNLRFDASATQLELRTSPFDVTENDR
jgi:hypothetical protein